VGTSAVVRSARCIQLGVPGTVRLKGHGHLLGTAPTREASERNKFCRVSAQTKDSQIDRQQQKNQLPMLRKMLDNQ